MEPSFPVVRDIVISAVNYINHVAVLGAKEGCRPFIISTHILRLSIWLSLGCSIATGTTLVGIWRPDRITIAADNKITVTDTKTGAVVSSLQGCKVFQIGNSVVAMAGLFQEEQIDMVSAIKNARLFRDSVTNKPLPSAGFSMAAQGVLKRVLAARDAKQDGRSVYDPALGITMIVVSIIENDLFMYRLQYRSIVPPGPGYERFSYQEIQYPTTEQANFAIELGGIFDTANRFRMIDQNWNAGGDVATARRLIAIEASDTVASRFVGTPITTVVIDKTGVKWEDKGVCQ